MGKSKRSKEERDAMDKFLKEKFEELAEGQELIPVVLDRASWESLRYTIDLALQLKHKKKK